MTSLECEAICKTTLKNCSYQPKISFQGKNLCLIHYNQIKSLDKCETMCIICMENIGKKNTIIKISPCGHEYHKSCIKKWFDSTKDSCPLCRTKCDSTTLIKLNSDFLDYIHEGIFTLPTTYQTKILNDIVHIIHNAHQEYSNQMDNINNMQFI